jgi:surface antigen
MWGQGMAARGGSGRILAIGSLLSLVVPLVVPLGSEAVASTYRAAHRHGSLLHETVAHGAYRGGFDHAMRGHAGFAWHGLRKGRVAGARWVRRGGGLQCVTFARGESGIELSGNAADWWYNAAGVYQRGSRPELGSVLNFRANPRMRLGHVAVVTSVIDPRQIEIDQANWAGPGAYRGGVSRSIRVVDVSPANDWSAVRVALGHSDDFGSVYPTYGFIYDRADHGAPMVTEAQAAPMPRLNPAPRDLRPAFARRQAPVAASYDEVAEAPSPAGIDLSIGPQMVAPGR